MTVPYGQHPSPGAPYTWSRDVYRALNCLAGRGRWRDRQTFTHEGMVIVPARPNHPYGRSTGRNAYLTHVPRDVYIAWRRGVVVGHVIAWRCGARTAYFRFIDEPDSPICPVCLIDRTNLRKR